MEKCGIAVNMFKDVGFRVVHSIANKSQEEMYILVPEDKKEDAEYGAFVMSSRAMEAINTYLFNQTTRRCTNA